MALFGKLSGKKEIAPTPQEAIQKLRETEEILMKKTDYLEKKIDEEIATAKKLGTKNKRLALQALKRKKLHEKQLQQVDGTLSTLEYERESLEGATYNFEVWKTTEIVAKALKAVQKSMDPDKVQDMMDDIAEHSQMVEEISSIIATPMNIGYDFDEDELLAELEELKQEELNEELLNISAPPTNVLPVAPKRVKEENFEENNDARDFAELKAWATGS